MITSNKNIEIDMYEAIKWPPDMAPSRSPIHFTNELEVTASPDTIWSLLVDQNAWPSFYPGVEIVELLDGNESLNLGTRFETILVTNVGTAYIREYNGIEDIATIPDEDWLGLFQLNVMSGVRVARQYLPRMVAKGWGRVVFVSSESEVNLLKEMLDYGMTKTAQLAVSRGLAESVAGTGVTVNAVLPGPTRSEILGEFMAKRAEANGIMQEEAEQGFLAAMRPTTLIKRFATTDEVANMIVYACSEQAPATSGAALRVDGGVVRSIG